MRRSFDALALAVRERLALDPESGALFVFASKRGNRLKVLWLSVASKVEGVRIEKNEGRREGGSERGVDFLGLSEDVLNDVPVTTQSVA
jgi:hypothetical protein